MSNEQPEKEGAAGGGGGEGDFGVAEIVRILLAHVRLIVGMTLIVGALVTLVAFILPNRYEGVATVQIDPRAKKIVNIEGVLADLKADAATIDSEVEIIRSRAISMRVIDQLNLREDPEFMQKPIWRPLAQRLGFSKPDRTPAPRGTLLDDDAPRKSRDFWNFWSGLDDTLQSPERDELATAFESRLKAQRVRSSHLIEIKFWASNAVRSAQIVNAIAEAYLRSQIEAKSRAQEVAGELLDDRLKGLRDKVAAAEREVERYKADHNIFGSDGALLIERQLTRESEALINARNQTGEARARLDAARRLMLEGERGSESVADVLQNSTVRLLRDELTRVLRREAELGTKYGPRHPDMQRIAADIAKAQTELAGEISKITRNVKTELSVAEDRERQIEARIETLKREINETKEMHWKLRELEREASASRQLLEALLQRSKQTEEAMGLQLPDARIVVASDVPLSPSAPKRKIIVAGGFIGGLVLGVALAFLIELTKAGFTRGEQIERSLKIPHLASLPAVQTGDGKDGRLRLFRMMLADNGGLFAESLRTLRHEIDRARTWRGAEVILITSSVAGEGKSVTASNLALHYAATGHRTLLIDADLRKRELTRALMLDGRPGVVEVITEGLPIERCLLRDGSTGLFVLPSAAKPLNRLTASELLASEHWRTGLKSLRRQFDTIIVDAPPVLPVLDARILSRDADLVVMVAAWRRTPPAQLRRALKSLSRYSRRIVGVTLNQVAPEFIAMSLGTTSKDRYHEEPSAAPPRNREQRAA